MGGGEGALGAVPPRGSKSHSPPRERDVLHKTAASLGLKSMGNPRIRKNETLERASLSIIYNNPSVTIGDSKEGPSCRMLHT